MSNDSDQDQVGVIYDGPFAAVHVGDRGALATRGEQFDTDVATAAKLVRQATWQPATDGDATAIADWEAAQRYDEEGGEPEPSDETGGETGEEGDVGAAPGEPFSPQTDDEQEAH